MEPKLARVVILCLSVFLVFLLVGSAFSATYNNHKLVGGIWYRTYSIAMDYAGLSSAMRTAISNWNSTSTKFYYTEASSPTTLTFYALDYGNTGWCGLASQYDQSGIEIDPYTQDWYTAAARLNSYTNICVTAPGGWSGVATHEVGHTIGLAHSLNTQALMYKDIGAATPQSEDINETNNLYP